MPRQTNRQFREGDTMRRPIPQRTEEARPASTEQKYGITKVLVGQVPVRIRVDADINSRHTGLYAKNKVYEILEVKEGPGSKRGWGFLKDGSGWIALDFVQILD